MEELNLIENGLVTVYETSTGEKVVYGTELYERLGSKQEYSNWTKNRLKECDAIENEDFTIILSKSTGGRPKNEYIIKLDTAKEMAMLERNAKGKQVRRYFIQLEKKYKAGKVQMEQHLAEMLKSFDERIQVLEQRRNQKISVNPYGTSRNTQIEERKKELYSLTSKVAGLCKMSQTKILHYMYRTLEEDLGIVLDAYKSVYISQTGKTDVCMVEVIAANDQLYDSAVEMNQSVIERKQIYG